MATTDLNTAILATIEQLQQLQQFQFGAVEADGNFDNGCRVDCHEDYWHERQYERLQEEYSETLAHESDFIIDVSAAKTPSIDVTLNVGITLSSLSDVTPSDVHRFKQSVVNKSVLKGITPPEITVDAAIGVMAIHQLSANETPSSVLRFLLSEMVRVFGSDCLNTIYGGGHYIVRSSSAIQWNELKMGGVQ